MKKLDEILKKWFPHRANYDCESCKKIKAEIIEAVIEELPKETTIIVPIEDGVYRYAFGRNQYRAEAIRKLREEL